jgi:hypothetical protein
MKAETLEKALVEWRWQIYTDKASENVTSISFEGEKLGDEQILFNALAPYVEPDSYIEVDGEDSNRWRWVFNGKTCEEISAEVDYKGFCNAFRAILKHKEILPTLIGIHPVLDAEIAKVSKCNQSKV